LLDKYANQIVTRLGQGGLGTDAARAMLESAYPNKHMNLPAIREAVANLSGAQDMVQAKARYLLEPRRSATRAPTRSARWSSTRTPTRASGSTRRSAIPLPGRRSPKNSSSKTRRFLSASASSRSYGPRLPMSLADDFLGPAQPLTLAEKYIAPALEQMFGTSNIQGSPIGRVIQGAADPGIGISQLVANATGFGDKMNQGVHDLEERYQSERAAAGSTGFDPLRMAGNVGVSVLAPGATAAPKAGLLANMLRGGATGAAFNAAQPVTDAQPQKLSDLVTGDMPNDYWTEKGKQTAIGAGFGAAGVPVASALASVVRPNTSQAARKLMDEGITLTPGQILGGGFHRAEDAATSIPVLGDFIRDAKNRTLADFNRAAYGRALRPIGEDASKLPVGPEGVLAVKSKLGDAYDALLPKLTFDARSIAPELKALVQKSVGLGPQERETFKAILQKNMSQLSNGKADGETFKLIESNLGTEAKAFREGYHHAV
jgi:hypothetical protein